MRIADMNWMQVEEYLTRDDRAVLPIGSTEQHAYLSLATDNTLAERVAIEAAEPLGVPVFPIVPYGITPAFRAYPGTVSMREETLFAVLGDALDALAGHGFRRVLIVNGHGGNAPAAGFASGHATARGIAVRFHNWWRAPKVWAKVQAIDPAASHASWMENLPWTRLAGVAMPAEPKPLLPIQRLAGMTPEDAREFLGDGSFGGRYFRDDADVLAMWAVAVEETRALLVDGW